MDTEDLAQAIARWAFHQGPEQADQAIEELRLRFLLKETRSQIKHRSEFLRIAS